MLQACEAHHQNEKCGRIGTDYAPLYHLQGFSVQADMPYITLFRSFGYESYESYRRRMNLATYRLPEDFEQRKNALAKEGVQIGALPETFLSEFLSAENSFSNSYWAWEYGVKFAADPDLTKARVAIQNGRLIGGCMFGDPNSDEGRFGPFGMSPDSRGRGIGSLLFADCLNEMKKRGIPSAWAQWTPLTGAANTLNNKAGFLMEDCFVTFWKEWK